MLSAIPARGRSGARGPARTTWSLCTALLLLGALSTANISGALAQGTAHRLTSSQQEALRGRLNETTLIVATSHPSASYFTMAQDMAAAIGGHGELRLLPIPSDAGADALRDLLFLRGVDMAIVPANALAMAKATEFLGPGLPQRIAFVTRLYNEEVHLLVGRNTTAIEDLRGKKVAVPQDDGGAFFTAKDLFSRFRINVDVVAMPAAEALEQVRSGALPAVLLMAGKPSPLLAGLPKDGSIRLLGLPFAASMEEAYSPAAFRADDYPTLIPDGVVVESVAVSAVLVAHTPKSSEDSWLRASRFVPVFFSAVSERLLLRRLAKWREVNLAATLPGWSRLPAAEEWLRKAQQQQVLSLQKSFEEFLRETRPPGSPSLTAAERKNLFDEFVSWTRKSVSETDASANR